MNLLALSGSLRSGSHTRELLRIATELAPAGAEIVLWDGLRDIPPFDEDMEAAPGAAVVSLREAVAGADAVLIATPEYNGSIPGQLKNALDWASRPYATNPFREKTVAVVSSSTGMFGGLQAQADLKRVLARMGARVADTELAVPNAHERLAQPDDLLLEDVRSALAAVYGAAAAAAKGRLVAAA